MGITPIGDASALADQLVSNLSQVKQTSGATGDFKSVWNDQAASSSNAADDSRLPMTSNRDNGKNQDSVRESGNVNKNTPENRTEKSDEASKTDVKGKESPEKTESVKNNDTEGKVLKDEEVVSATEVLSAIVSDLEAKIAEILNMDPEELNALLEETVTDPLSLLDKEDLSAFMLKALDADSELSLLTNEEDYAKFSEAMNALTDVLDNVTPVKEMTVSELKAAVDEIAAEEKPFAEVRDENAPKAPELEREDRLTVRFVRNSNGDLERADVTESGTEVGEAKVVRSADEAQKQSQDTGKDTGENHQAAAMNLNEDASLKAVDNVPETVQGAAPESYVSDPQQIADQILDHMKTVTDGDFSDVEMQLHPASLGTVQIHVTNNAGVITASFVTENEAVRAAVESQIIRLNEQLEAQGIRVEAVEVTVASHSFEGNLESGNREASEESGSSRRRTRRIELGDDPEDLDVSSMEDDERIAAEMMAANGNKVDYTA